MRPLVVVAMLAATPSACAAGSGPRLLREGRITSVHAGIQKGFEKHPDVEDCRSFALTAEQVRVLISKARVITLREANEEFDWAPCIVSGVISSSRESAAFEITAGLVATVRFGDGHEVYFGCDGACANAVYASEAR